MKRCLERIEAVDRDVEAWRYVDTDRALATAAEREREAARGELRGPLHGIPVGVKDIIDVEGLTTQCQSPTRAGVAPAAADAEVVAALRSVGAIVLGKVHTTEFAFLDPAPTRNPHHLEHTPGGSSSGSAAAVASGTVPLAIGTQTMASVNRPAAYCGVASFKPTTGSMSGFGISPLAPSYDTTGFFGSRVDDVVLAFESVASCAFGSRTTADPVKHEDLVVAVLHDPMMEWATKDAVAAREAVCDRASQAGARLIERRAPVSLERVLQLLEFTMTYEASRALAHLLALPERDVGERLRETLHHGRAIETDRYLAARRDLDGLRATFFDEVGHADAFVWPATPAPAPRGLESTGDFRFIAPWTALGSPIVSVPGAVSAEGLPLSTLVCGRPGRDLELVDLCRALKL
ncbi:MAG: amidase [Candidatus Binatia bacterium]|nr:amidase [Candidatus Binatia bacterium]